MSMVNTLRKALESFSDHLTANVGKDLACSIINYAQLPNELEAVFLKTDGLAGLEEETKTPPSTFFSSITSTPRAAFLAVIFAFVLTMGIQPIAANKGAIFEVLSSDTIGASKNIFTLKGIDASELGQICKCCSGRDYNCRLTAKLH